MTVGKMTFLKGAIEDDEMMNRRMKITALG